jgi:hypothetical protein
VERVFAYVSRALDRRRVLGGALAAAFGTLAGVAVGRSPAAIAANPCTAPGQTKTSCGCACSGPRCGRCGNVSCNAYIGCQQSQCWAKNGKMCCDCQCGAYGYWWFCFCYG